MRSFDTLFLSQRCLVPLCLNVVVGCNSASTEGTVPADDEATAVQGSGGSPTAQVARGNSTAPARSEAAPGAQVLPSALVAERAASCASLCKKTEPLKCPAQSKCDSACLQSFSAPICTAELGQFLACTSESKLAHFACDPDSGNPMLKDGYCDREQEAVVKCLAGALQL